MSYHPQQQFLGSSPGGCSSQGRTHIPFDHRIDSLGLPALAIEFGIRLSLETIVHIAAMPCCRRVGAGTAGVGRDDRTHAHVLPSDAMVCLRVIPRIGHDRLHTGPPQGIKQQGLAVGWPRCRSFRGRLGSGDMRVHGQRELGQPAHHLGAAAVGHRFSACFPLFLACVTLALPLAFLEMPTDVAH